LKLGVLGLQGDFREHVWAFRRLGANVAVVKTRSELCSVDGLIIPGGESTTIGRLMKITGIERELQKLVSQGFPVYGTCAGMILLSKGVVNYPAQKTLGFIDIFVERNAYGRQVESFEANLRIPVLGERPFKALFIRAPKVVKCSETVKIMASYQGSPVFLIQNNIMVTSFHPELGDDTRIHEYFLNVVGDYHACTG